MVRKSNFIVEGKCFIPINVNDKLYDNLIEKMIDYFYWKGYNRLSSSNPYSRRYLFQQTFSRNIPDNAPLKLKLKKFLRLITKSQYDQEVYFLTLNKLTDDTPINISYSIVPAKIENISGCVMKIRVEPAIIFKMKQLNPIINVSESVYKDIIDSNCVVIHEFVEAFCFDVVEKPCASSDYLFISEDKKSLITICPSCFKVPESNILTEFVSVMMPFKNEYNSVYSTIKQVCNKVGLECRRADDFWNNSILIQDIFELIYSSSIVIIDFSEKNPNVFYEAGIAHTLGKEVVPLTQNIKDIPFDLTHHRHIEYINDEEGLERLKTKIEERLQTLKSKQIQKH